MVILWLEISPVALGVNPVPGFRAVPVVRVQLGWIKMALKDGRGKDQGLSVLFPLSSTSTKPRGKGISPQVKHPWDTTNPPKIPVSPSYCSSRQLRCLVMGERDWR